MKFAIGMLIVASFLLQGCATKRTAAWDRESATSSLSVKERTGLLKTGMDNWKERHVKESLQKSLKAFEKIAKSDSADYRSRVFLCRGYYLLADGHTDEMEEKKRLWETGITWGEAAMATNPKFKEKMKETEGKVEAALHLLTENEVEAIYWTAVNLGKWGKNAGIATILKYKTRIKDMINRVGELKKDYFFGAFDRYWAAYYSVAPSFAGGDLDKAEKSFERTMGIAKNYLGSYVLMAEVYATKRGDKKLFREKLNFVLNANAKAIPEVYSENIIEQNKAKKLLAKEEDLF